MSSLKLLFVLTFVLIVILIFLQINYTDDATEGEITYNDAKLLQFFSDLEKKHGIKMNTNKHNIEFIKNTLQQKYGINLSQSSIPQSEQDKLNQLAKNISKTRANSLDEYIKLQKDIKVKEHMQEGMNTPVKFIGCFNDNPNRTLTTRHYNVTGNSQQKIEQCAQYAKGSSNPLFGLQANAECWSGPLNSDYSKYGKSNTCGETGGFWSQNIYGITELLPELSNKNELKGCFRDDNKRTIPGDLGQVNNQFECAKKAKDRGFNTYALQYNGQCFAGNNPPYDRIGKVPSDRESAECNQGGRMLGGAWTQFVYAPPNNQTITVANAAIRPAVSAVAAAKSPPPPSTPPVLTDAQAISYIRNNVSVQQKIGMKSLTVEPTPEQIQAAKKDFQERGFANKLSYSMSESFVSILPKNFSPVRNTFSENMTGTEFNTLMSSLTNSNIKISKEPDVQELINILSNYGVDAKNKQQFEAALQDFSSFGADTLGKINFFINSAVNQTKFVKSENLLHSVKLLKEYGVNQSDNSKLKFSKAYDTILKPFGITQYYMLRDLDDRLKSIGKHRHFGILNTLQNFGINNYNELQTSKLFELLKKLGANQHTNIDELLALFRNFQINKDNLNTFITGSNINNVNDIISYIKTLTQFGMQYNAQGEEFIKSVCDTFKLPTEESPVPSWTHTINVINELKKFGIDNMSSYNNFNEFMKKRFVSVSFNTLMYDSELNKFNGNIDMKQTDIVNIVKRLESCGYVFNPSDNMLFEHLVKKWMGMNVIGGNDTSNPQHFTNILCNVHNAYNATVKNVDNFTSMNSQNLKNGISTTWSYNTILDKPSTNQSGLIGYNMRETFQNNPEMIISNVQMVDVSRKFGISDVMNASLDLDGNPVSYIVFNNLLRSIGINNVDKYEKILTELTNFGANTQDFYTVIFLLNSFGVPYDDYTKFIKRLNDIGVTNPNFKEFITTISNFGITYPYFEVFMEALTKMGIKYKPNKDSPFFRFLEVMSTYGLTFRSITPVNMCQANNPNDSSNTIVFLNAVMNLLLMGLDSSKFFKTNKPGSSVEELFEELVKYDSSLADFMYRNDGGRYNTDMQSSETPMTPTNVLSMIRFMRENKIPDVYLIVGFMNDDIFAQALNLTIDVSTMCSIGDSIHKYNLTQKKIETALKYNEFNRTANMCKLFPFFTSQYMIKFIILSPTMYKNDQTNIKNRRCKRFMYINNDTECPVW